MNFHYTYALLALIMCGLGGIAVLVRRDLWPHVLWAGLAGGALESVAEIWYLQDYWRPLTLLPLPTPEDFCYGFGLTMLTVCVAPIVLRERYVEREVIGVGWRLTVGLMIAFCLVMETMMVSRPRLPSIWTAVALFVLAGFLGCIMHPELVVPALLVAVVMGGVATVGYTVGLDIVVDGKVFLRQVLLLQNTHWDVRVFGNVPLDEIVWNMARGFCVAVLYPAISGRELAPR